MLASESRNADSYAVIDQIRTVNADRFGELYENGAEYDAQMSKEDMRRIYKAVIQDLLHDVPSDELLHIIF